MLPWPRSLRSSAMLLNDHVGIDTAEAKSIHARPPGFRPAVDPGPGFGVQVERCLLQLELRIRLFAVDGGRQYFVMQGEASLDESGDPGSRHGVANHRLNRPQCTPRQFAGALAEGPG